MHWSARTVMTGVFLALVVAGSASAGEAEELAEFRAFMASRNDKTSEIVRQIFPLDYAAVERRIARDYAMSHDSNAALLALASFANEIRARYFHEIANAPAEDLRAIATAKISQYKLFQRLEPVACQQMGEKGALDLELGSRVMQMRRDPGSDTGTPQFLALKHAREHPVNWNPITQTDQEAIVREYLRRGGDLDYLESRETGADGTTLSPEDRCRNIILLNEAVLAMPSEVAARFWAAAYRATP